MRSARSSLTPRRNYASSSSRASRSRHRCWQPAGRCCKRGSLPPRRRSSSQEAAREVPLTFPSSAEAWDALSVPEKRRIITALIAKSRRAQRTADSISKSGSSGPMPPTMTSTPAAFPRASMRPWRRGSPSGSSLSTAKNTRTPRSSGPKPALIRAYGRLILVGFRGVHAVKAGVLPTPLAGRPGPAARRSAAASTTCPPTLQAAASARFTPATCAPFVCDLSARFLP